MVAWSLAAVAAVLAVGDSLLNLYGRIPLLASLSTQGTQPCLAVEGTTTGEVLEAYSELIPGPALRSGEVVGMNKLSFHKGGSVCELIEG
jgi:hypothetical protein